MADSAASLYRSGAISPKQADKHKLAVLKKTKVERDNEEAFHGKQGLRDQGGYRDRGHKVATVNHIEGPDQGMGKFKPSKGGAVGNPRGAGGATKRNEIDASGTQKPDFPRSAGSSKASKGGRGYEDGDEGPDEMDASANQKPSFPREGSGRETGNKRARGKIAKQGGLYGGGGRNTQ